MSNTFLGRDFARSVTFVNAYDEALGLSAVDNNDVDAKILQDAVEKNFKLMNRLKTKNFKTLVTLSFGQLLVCTEIR